MVKTIFQLFVTAQQSLGAWLIISRLDSEKDALKIHVQALFFYRSSLIQHQDGCTDKYTRHHTPIEFVYAINFYHFRIFYFIKFNLSTIHFGKMYFQNCNSDYWWVVTLVVNIRCLIAKNSIDVLSYLIFEQ